MAFANDTIARRVEKMIDALRLVEKPVASNNVNAERIAFATNFEGRLRISVNRIDCQ